MLEKILSIINRNNWKSLWTLTYAAVSAEANKIIECHYKIEFGGSHF